MLALVGNDDAFILERTRCLQGHRQQAGSCKGGVRLITGVNENRSQARASSTRAIDIEWLF